MDLTINVDALDKTASAVESASDRTEVEELELLVTGNKIPLTISFCDDDGATPSFVTDAGVVISVGLGSLSVNGETAYASASSLDVSGNTRTGNLNVDTDRLRTAVYNLMCGPLARRGQVIMTLEVRKTTAAGLVETLALLRVYVSLRVLPQTVSGDENFDGPAAALVSQHQTTMTSGDVTILPSKALHSERVVIAGVARTSTLRVGVAVSDGAVCEMRVELPTTSGILIAIRDDVTSDLLATLSSDDGGGAAVSTLVLLYYSGTPGDVGAAWKKKAIISPVY